MKQVWIMDWTEFEFGQRPDGTSMHSDLAKAMMFREKHSVGGSDYFWRASDPRTIFVSEEKYAELLEQDGNMWATSTKWLKTNEAAI